MFALYENLAVPVVAFVLLFFHIELFSWSRWDFREARLAQKRGREWFRDHKKKEKKIIWGEKKKIILGEKVGRSHAKACNPLKSGLVALHPFVPASAWLILILI